MHISVPTDHPVVSKEQAGGFYHFSAYYVAKLISEIPLVLIDPSIYFIITFWVAGIGGPMAFFGCWAILILDCLAGQVLYHIIVTYTVYIGMSKLCFLFCLLEKCNALWGEPETIIADTQHK